MAAGPRNARRKRLSAPATADGRGLNRVLLSEGASLASSPIAPSAVVGVINAFCASLSSGTRSAIAVVGVCLLALFTRLAEVHELSLQARVNAQSA